MREEIAELATMPTTRATGPAPAAIMIRATAAQESELERLLTIVQPGSWDETRALLRWAVEDAEESVAVRLAIGPSPRRIDLPATVSVGCGSVLHEGSDAVLLAYGPVMLHEALLAAERLDESGELSLRVVAMPWLNRFDMDWLAGEVATLEHVFVLEDHAPVGGLGDALRSALAGRAVTVFGVEGWPACGTPAEALRFHGLDGASLAGRIAAHAGVPAR